jgi:hypothetical protein
MLIPEFDDRCVSESYGKYSVAYVCFDRGLFYLPYTTGEPANNIREKRLRVIADYIECYYDEQCELDSEDPTNPEKESHNHLWRSTPHC